MDPVLMILGAFAGGAAAGARDAASSAVRDAYEALRVALASRLKDRPEAQSAMAEVGRDPEAATRALADHLAEAGVDDQLLDLASQLIAALEDSAQINAQVNADRIQGLQVGNGNAQTNTFHD